MLHFLAQDPPAWAIWITSAIVGLVLIVGALVGLVYAITKLWVAIGTLRGQTESQSKSLDRVTDRANTQDLKLNDVAIAVKPKGAPDETSVPVHLNLEQRP